MVARGLPAGLHLDSFDHKDQLRPAYHGLIAAERGWSKRAFFQSLIVENIPARLPVQQLDVGAPAVEKYKHLPTRWIPAQLVAHQSGQAVKAFSHIAYAAIKMVAVRGTQAEHTQYIRISSPIKATSPAGSESRIPLG